MPLDFVDLHSGMGKNVDKSTSTAQLAVTPQHAPIAPAQRHRLGLVRHQSVRVDRAGATRRQQHPWAGELSSLSGGAQRRRPHASSPAARFLHERKARRKRADRGAPAVSDCVHCMPVRRGSAVCARLLAGVSCAQPKPVAVQSKPLPSAAVALSRSPPLPAPVAKQAPTPAPARQAATPKQAPPQPRKPRARLRDHRADLGTRDACEGAGSEARPRVRIRHRPRSRRIHVGAAVVDAGCRRGDCEVDRLRCLESEARSRTSRRREEHDTATPRSRLPQRTRSQAHGEGARGEPAACRRETCGSAGRREACCYARRCKACREAGRSAGSTGKQARHGEQHASAHAGPDFLRSAARAGRSSAHCGGDAVPRRQGRAGQRHRHQPRDAASLRDGSAEPVSLLGKRSRRSTRRPQRTE